MAHTAKAAAAPVTDPVYLMRDKLTHDYQPANERERMLVTQMAQSWVRLQRALEAESLLFQDSNPLTIIRTDSDTFAKVSRYVADCERAWRRAMEELHRVQRQRLGPYALRNLASPRPRTANPPPHAAPVGAESQSPLSPASPLGQSSAPPAPSSG